MEILSTYSFRADCDKLNNRERITGASRSVQRMSSGPVGLFPLCIAAPVCPSVHFYAPMSRAVRVILRVERALIPDTRRAV